jgi:dienelactone hydrolase
LILPAVQGESRAEEGPIEAELRRLGKPFETYVYTNARIGFDNPNMPDAYNPTLADDAWARTVAFLGKHLQTEHPRATSLTA